MNPFILQFKEKPSEDESDYSVIEYDATLNLSLHKTSGRPAIEFVALETDTFTKAGGEAHDTDRSPFHSLMDTATMTYTGNEPSDADRDIQNLQMLLDTTTVTRSTEGSDQDQ